MTIAKSAIALLAAAGLVAAPVAAQEAPARSASDVAQHEELRGQSAVLYLAVIAFIAALFLVVGDEDSFDDVDDLPASP